MKMTMSQVRLVAHDKLCSWRSIDYLINTPRFEKAFEVATTDDREKMLSILDNIDDLRKWMNDVLRQEIGDMTVAQLRKLACELNIRDYMKMSKSLLLSYIQEKMDEQQK